MKTILLIALVAFLTAFSVGAAPLTESTFTEIVHEVNTLSTDGTATASQVNEMLKAPQRVRTGPESRAELMAADHTVTRVGANTVFSFGDSGRALNLEQGSLLFHAPKGIGGGTINSGGASAAVLGTTIIVAANEKGGFKVILLEGKGKVVLPGGISRILYAGQEIFVLPDGAGFSRVFDINLDKLVKGSLLVGGFSHQLSSWSLILAAIQHQNSLLASGRDTDTGLPPELFVPPPSPGNGLGVLSPGTYQTAVPPPLSLGQVGTLTGGTYGSLQVTAGPSFYRPGPGPYGSTGGRGILPVSPTTAGLLNNFILP